MLLAVAGGLLSGWIVLRRLAFFTHAAGTATFPGLGHARTPAGAGAVMGGAVVAVVAGLAGVAISFALSVATGASVALALCAAAVAGASLPAFRPQRPRGRPAAHAG